MSAHRMLVIALVLASACSKEATSPGTGSAAAPTGAPGGPLAGAAASASFAGTFQGDIQGAASTLTAQVQGDKLVAAIDAGGYGYKLTGTIADARATGTMTDPQTGASMQFVATLMGRDLQVSIDAEGTQLVLTFQRATGGSPSVASVPTAETANAPATPSGAGNGERDPSIIGSWRYREQLGDTRTGSMLIRWFLHVRPDGTFTYGNDRSQHDGQWQTKNGVVYVNDGSGWEAYAKYTLGPQGMMFTFGDGSRRLFKRG